MPFVQALILTNLNQTKSMFQTHFSGPQASDPAFSLFFQGSSLGMSTLLLATEQPQVPPLTEFVALI